MHLFSSCFHFRALLYKSVNDDNPMRGLSKYRPFDAKYFDVFPKDVLAVSVLLLILQNLVNL